MELFHHTNKRLRKQPQLITLMTITTIGARDVICIGNFEASPKSMISVL